MNREEHIKYLINALNQAQSSLIVTQTEIRDLTIEEQAQILFNRGCGNIQAVEAEYKKKIKRLDAKHKKDKANLVKMFSERIKQAFYYEFDELIPSIMADKINEIAEELLKNE